MSSKKVVIQRIRNHYYISRQHPNLVDSASISMIVTKFVSFIRSLSPEFSWWCREKLGVQGITSWWQYYARLLYGFMANRCNPNNLDNNWDHRTRQPSLRRWARIRMRDWVEVRFQDVRPAQENVDKNKFVGRHTSGSTIAQQVDFNFCRER